MPDAAEKAMNAVDAEYEAAADGKKKDNAFISGLQEKIKSAWHHHLVSLFRCTITGYFNQFLHISNADLSPLRTQDARELKFC